MLLRIISNRRETAERDAREEVGVGAREGQLCGRSGVNAVGDGEGLSTGVGEPCFVEERRTEGVDPGGGGIVVVVVAEDAVEVGAWGGEDVSGVGVVGLGEEAAVDDVLLAKDVVDADDVIVDDLLCGIVDSKVVGVQCSAGDVGQRIVVDEFGAIGV